MRLVMWTDEYGYRHRSLVRDSDPDSAADIGIPQDPPDLRLIDWGEVQRELHNRLVDANLTSWEDVQKQQSGVSGAVLGVLLRKVIDLYRADFQARRTVNEDRET